MITIMKRLDDIKKHAPAAPAFLLVLVMMMLVFFSVG